jgi:hypothetical protein
MLSCCRRWMERLQRPGLQPAALPAVATAEGDHAALPKETPHWAGFGVIGFHLPYLLQHGCGIWWQDGQRPAYSRWRPAVAVPVDSGTPAN